MKESDYSEFNQSFEITRLKPSEDKSKRSSSQITP